MRITKSLFFTALLTLFLGTTYANNTPESTSARTEIKNLIKKADLVSNLNSDVTVHVTFMVNDLNELIIMSTDQEKLDTSIKYALNYKKLKSTDVKVNTKYTLPVVLKM